MNSIQASTYSRRQFLALAAKASLVACAVGSGAIPLARSATAAPLAQLSSLSAAFASEIEVYPGLVALSVYDLQSGQTISINGSRPQAGACTSNLFLLFAVVQDLEKRLYSIDEVDWIVRAAVGASDPRWARQLVIRTGGGSLARGVARVNDVMADVGAANSFYDHAPEYLREYSLANRDNVVTSDDLNVGLGKLYRGELFSPRYTSYAIAKLLDVRPHLNNVIPALLPSVGVRVAHKIGFINYAGYATYNDSGLVMIDRGDREIAYAISYLSQFNRNYWAAPGFGARLSRTVFDYFESAH